MKILITGTAGFIGFHLANRLIADGNEVVGLDIVNDYYDVNLKLDRLKYAGIYIDGEVDVEESQDSNQRMKGRGTTTVTKVKSEKFENYTFYKMDLNDREKIKKLFEEEAFDVVIHLAAQAGVRYSLENPHAYIESNITGFLNILEGCRHHPVDHLIYASSSSVYGSNEEIPFKTEHNVDHPVSLYAASKKSNELMAHTYSHLFGIPATGLRFFTVYGPWGRPDMALYIFADKMTAGKPIDVYNYGKMSRDFTYVGDIVESVVRLVPYAPGENEDSIVKGENPKEVETSVSSGTIDKEETSNIEGFESGREVPVYSGRSVAPCRVFNIGHGSPVDLMEFIETIEKELGIVAEKNLMPIQPGDVPKTWADVEDLFEVIDYRPKVPIGQGVKEFVKWYKEYYEFQF